MFGNEQVTEYLVRGSHKVPMYIQDLYGVVPRSIIQLFTSINKYITEKKMTFEVCISMMEIYNEVIIDLLTNPPTSGLKIREFPKVGMRVIGVQETPCCSAEDVFNSIAAGTANKHTASHAMNTRSSRSHTVFQVSVLGKFTTGSTVKSKINMVDLAGSERIKKTGAVGQSLEEAKKINLSLSNLGNCINAVVENRSSIPFRESKLTLILKDSLGGNSLTSLCVMTSKRMVHGDETLSTL